MVKEKDQITQRAHKVGIYLVSGETSVAEQEAEHTPIGTTHRYHLLHNKL